MVLRYMYRREKLYQKFFPIDHKSEHFLKPFLTKEIYLRLYQIICNQISLYKIAMVNNKSYNYMCSAHVHCFFGEILK